MLEEHCSDTLTDKNLWHSYLPLYERLFSSKKDSATHILEIGIGPNYPFNGGSLLMWANYFTNAKIHSMDIIPVSEVNPDVIQHPRIHLYTSSDAYHHITFYETFVATGMKFDMILDDGPHTLPSMIAFIEMYSRVLKEDGILVIEDVQAVEWMDTLRAVTPDELKPFIQVHDLRHVKGRYDDLVFVIDKSLKHDTLSMIDEPIHSQYDSTI